VASNGRQKALQFRGQRCNKREPLAGLGVMEFQFAGMQKVSLQLFGRSMKLRRELFNPVCAVQRISHNRVPSFGKMNPNLVRPSGFKPYDKN